MARFNSVEDLINKLEELKLSKFKWTYNEEDLKRGGMDRFIYHDNNLKIVLVVRDWLSFTENSDSSILYQELDYTWNLSVFENNKHIKLHAPNNIKVGHDYSSGTYKELFEHVDSLIIPYVRKSKLKIFA